MLDLIYQGLIRIEREFSKIEAPSWLVREGLSRAVLFINHVLLQEPEAMARIKRQRGKTIHLSWAKLEWRLILTPAGLVESLWTPGVEVEHSDVVMKPADLRIVCLDESMVSILNTWRLGEKPPLRIEGDVQLAAEVNWLLSNVNWDYEEDLSKVIGDVNAYHAARTIKAIQNALGQFAQKARVWTQGSKERHHPEHGVGV
jgi:ubiquinone biosynthesis accessory factor UbiJ